MHTRPHEKLIVWQEAYRLCLTIYRITKNFPADERFGLISQMQRAASSVVINIAEGNSRSSKKDRGHFWVIAHSSLEELHCECRLSCDLKYMTKEMLIQIDEAINRVSYLLGKLRSSLL